MAIDTNTVTVTPATADTKTVDAKKADAVRKMSQPKNATKGGAVRRLPIGDGETATRKIEVLDDNTVKASFTFKLSDASPDRYSATVLLDYTNCSKAEIMIDATRSHVITLQRNLRQMGDGALDASVYQKVDVKAELVESTRSTADPETRDLLAFARVAKIPLEDARKFLAAIASGKLKP